uniref:Claudin 4 n=1 Tax=Hucho hucho TaxID=62062 RepID=A0A4W5Q442_9TELE
MGSMGMQMLGSALALLGWVWTIIVCGVPMWRVTAFNGNNIVTSQTIWEGIWMSCVVQSTGQISDLQAARALVVVDIVVRIASLLIAFAGGKCTKFVVEEVAKAQVTVGAGVVLIISGFLCLIPVSWTASILFQDFYNPLLVDAQQRELGAALYIGWGAGIPGNCSPKEDNKGGGLVVRRSQQSSRFYKSYFSVSQSQL